MKKLLRRGERFKGLTVGLDVHKKFIRFSVLDEQGDEVDNDQVPPEGLGGLIERLTSGGTAVQAALEACGCFVWVFDLLAGKLGRERVHVAAPSRVRAIAEAREKTDATDAWWLAYLLHERRLPEAFVAEGDLRDLRVACRELRSATDSRSDLMRRLKSHLAQLGLGFSGNDWSSVAGRQRIAAVVAGMDAHGERGSAVARAWGLIDAMTEEVEHWRGRVKTLSAKFAAVRELDKQVAGVGELIAPVIWSELGDPRRYRCAKAYAKATGLTPGYRESGGKRSRQTITRQGSAHVRWALTRAVVSCLRCKKQGAGLWVRRWVERQGRRKPKKWAIVCAARKLAEGVWRLFNLGEAFDLARAFGAPASGR